MPRSKYHKSLKVDSNSLPTPGSSRHQSNDAFYPILIRQILNSNLTEFQIELEKDYNSKFALEWRDQQYGDNALSIALKNSGTHSEAIVKSLCEFAKSKLSGPDFKAYINSSNIKGEFPLYLAKLNSHHEIYNYLITQGATIESALKYAIISDNSYFNNERFANIVNKFPAETIKNLLLNNPDLSEKAIKMFAENCNKVSFNYIPDDWLLDHCTTLKEAISHKYVANASDTYVATIVTDNEKIVNNAYTAYTAYISNINSELNIYLSICEFAKIKLSVSELDFNACINSSNIDLYLAKLNSHKQIYNYLIIQGATIESALKYAIISDNSHFNKERFANIVNKFPAEIIKKLLLNNPDLSEKAIKMFAENCNKVSFNYIPDDWLLNHCPTLKEAISHKYVANASDTYVATISTDNAKIVNNAYNVYISNVNTELNIYFPTVLSSIVTLYITDYTKELNLVGEDQKDPT